MMIAISCVDFLCFINLTCGIMLVVNAFSKLYTYSVEGVKKMKNLKNYKSLIIMLIGIVIGGAVGLIWKEDAQVLSPFGDLFLNMLLIVVVPLIFLTITSSIYKMKHPKRIGKI